MTVAVELSSLLREHAGAASGLTLEAASVRALLAELERRHPRIHRSVCDETGALRRHVNLFVNTQNIRDHGGLDSALEPGDVVTFFQAVSGG